MRGVHYVYERRSSIRRKPLTRFEVERIRYRAIMVRRRILIAVGLLLGLMPVWIEGVIALEPLAAVALGLSAAAIAFLALRLASLRRLIKLPDHAEVVTFPSVASGSKSVDVIMPAAVVMESWHVPRSVKILELGATLDPPILDASSLPMVRRLSPSEMAELERSRVFRIQTASRFLTVLAMPVLLFAVSADFVEPQTWLAALILSAMPTLVPAFLADRRCLRALANPTVRVTKEGGRIIETLVVANGRVWSIDGQPAEWRIAELS